MTSILLSDAVSPPERTEVEPRTRSPPATVRSPYICTESGSLASPIVRRVVPAPSLSLIVRPPVIVSPVLKTYMSSISVALIQSVQVKSVAEPESVPTNEVAVNAPVVEL